MVSDRDTVDTLVCIVEQADEALTIETSHKTKRHDKKTMNAEHEDNLINWIYETP